MVMWWCGHVVIWWDGGTVGAAHLSEHRSPWHAGGIAKVWLELAREDLERRGLPDAVGADEPQHTPRARRG